MYLNFYQLHKKPFSLAPDPEFLYLSQQHKDALGAIIYGIETRAGFVSVVGEVGTGKTTIVRAYLHKAGRDKIMPIFIFNSRITFRELMKTFLYEIGIKAEVLKKIQNMNDMVRLAYKVMLEKTKQGKNIVLIIDEAQNMPIETLARLCILSNFETAKTKLVQIVLVGQPELQKKLDLHELRQLRQRIAYRAVIAPLSTKDSFEYITHRVALSSRIKRNTFFTTTASRQIVRHSKGVPRVINILCENALIAGYGLQKKPVSLKIVKQVIAEYEDKNISGLFGYRNIAVSMMVLLLTVLFAGGSLPLLNSHEEPTEEQAHYHTASDSSYQPVVSENINIPSSEEDLQKYEAEAPVQAANEHQIPVVGDSEASNSSDEALEIQPAEAIVSRYTPAALGGRLSLRSDGSMSLMENPELIAQGLLEQNIASRRPSHLKIAKRGDTVSKLCLETYGFVNTRVLAWLKSNNPHIYDIDEIQINEVLFFPEMEMASFLQPSKRFIRQSRGVREEVVSR